MRFSFFCALLPAVAAAGTLVTTGYIVERDGLARRGTLLEQGIPIAPLPAAQARRLVLRGADGRPLRATIEPEAFDQNGNVRWVRVSAVTALAGNGRLPVRLELGEADSAPALAVRRSTEGIAVDHPQYRLAVRPDHLRLSVAGRSVLDGPWGVELVGDTRAILWGANLSSFRATTAEIEDQSPTRATLLLKGYFGKNRRKEPDVAESGRRLECELRLFLTALSPQIRFSWRMTNLTGIRIWFQRYALLLPLAGKATLAGRTQPDRLVLKLQTGAPLGVTADFIEDLGRGAGMRLSPDGSALLTGGLDMPPDGGFFTGRIPDIHRLFYDGMSRTFRGALITTGSPADCAEERAPLDLVLPPQYYSDVHALPEQGDPVTFGEFEQAVKRSAEILLETQWRGTLFWGEWYREWDETRNMGVEEASNGHSPLAPLYHYWRTGDARFLRCARRSFEYTWDVQLSKSGENQGRMFHTRRHLFDELDWIHPRYQRATGGLVSSHVFLNPAARREIIETVRSFHQHMFDEDGVPHGWNKLKRARGPDEDGVDTSNFMEALAYCYRETGERAFLDWATQMSRWTAARYEVRGKRQGDDWNWNLTNYVLRGLVTLYETSDDPAVKDLALQISRRTLANTSTSGLELKDGIGGGELHFVFYHAWISTRVAKIAPDGDDLTRRLLAVVRREAARQRPDGLFPLDHKVENGMPTRWTSYYEAKSLVGYVPVLAAHLKRRGIR